MKYIVATITTPKSYLQMQQYLNGPSYNKVEAFHSGLSRLKIISCFLFRCQKRSSNHYICRFYVHFVAIHLILTLWLSCKSFVTTFPGAKERSNAQSKSQWVLSDWRWTTWSTKPNISSTFLGWVRRFWYCWSQVICWQKKSWTTSVYSFSILH